MKKLFAILLAFIMVFAMAACSQAKDGEDSQAQTDEVTAEKATEETTGEATEEAAGETKATLMNITVTVVHADGSSKEFTYETDQEFVGPVLVAAGLIQGNEGPYGLEITHVDGEQAIYDTDKAYWALYEGEEYALQGIDTTPVVDGGVYKLVYTGA